jgi:hypothetical protein
MRSRQRPKRPPPRQIALRARFVCARRPHTFTTPCSGFHRRGMAPETFVGLAGRLVQMIGMIGNLATPNQIPSTPLAGRFALSSPNSVERQRGTAGSAAALKIVTAHSRSAQNLGEQRGGAVLCAAARPVNIKKGIFPALASLFISLVGTPFGWGATPAGKNVGSSVGDAWERSTMKLFRIICRARFRFRLAGRSSVTTRLYQPSNGARPSRVYQKSCRLELPSWP